MLFDWKFLSENFKMQISFRSVSGENIKNIIENDYTINSACCYLGQKLKINPNQVFILNPSKNSKFIYSNCHVIKYSQLQSNKNYLFFRTLFSNYYIYRIISYAFISKKY